MNAFGSVDDILSSLEDSHKREKEAAAKAPAQTTTPVVSLADRKAEVMDSLSKMAAAPAEKTAGVAIPDNSGVEALRKTAAQINQAESIADVQSGALIGAAAADAFMSRMDKYAGIAVQTQKQTRKQASPAVSNDLTGEQIQGLMKQAALNGRNDATTMMMKRASALGKAHAEIHLTKQAELAGRQDAAAHAEKTARVDESMQKLADACFYAYNDASDLMDRILVG